ncbi:MAG: type II toxin-antitoxin system RelE/ParE family toxin [Clostridiales bacterium]|nr:type II toxin-antitoxin system RelE/ParE family toxin [Clostridiales bacterium]
MEKYRVVVTPSADMDMDGICGYISKNPKKPKAAALLIDRLYKGLRTLETLPKQNTLLRDQFHANQGFRCIQIGNYLVFYIVHDKTHTVVVHRVLYGKRNYSAIFGASEAAEDSGESI